MIELKYEINVKTKSEANGRECWQAKASRAKEQRKKAKVVTQSMILGMDQSKSVLGAILGEKQTYDYREYKRIIVTLTRKWCGSRPLDSDNLAGSQKAVRDGIAEAFGIDDGDSIWDWKYNQTKCQRGHFGTMVSIRFIEEVCDGAE